MYEGVLSASHVEAVAIVKGEASIMFGVDTATDDGFAAVEFGRLDQGVNRRSCSEIANKGGQEFVEERFARERGDKAGISRDIGPVKSIVCSLSGELSCFFGSFVGRAEGPRGAKSVSGGRAMRESWSGDKGGRRAVDMV